MPDDERQTMSARHCLDKVEENVFSENFSGVNSRAIPTGNPMLSSARRNFNRRNGQTALSERSIFGLLCLKFK